MANRFPLTLDPLAQQIREIGVGDSFDLTGSPISSNLTPLEPRTYSLGELGFQWLDVHADNIWGTLQTGSQPGLFEVGTITAGQWHADPVGTEYGGTGASITPDAGALVYSTSASMALTPVGSPGQVLTSSGSGTPAWSSSLALTNLTVTSFINLPDQRPVRFYEGGGGPNSVQLRAPLNISGDYILSLPDGPGSPGEVLQTDGAGNLSWVGNAGTFIADGDSSVAITDPGAGGGAIAFRTDNFVRWEIGPSGDLIPSTASVYDIGASAQRVAAVHADEYYGTLFTASQPNVTGVGALTSGTWNADVISPAFGGTGVANDVSHTITLGGEIDISGPLVTSGGFGITFTTSGPTGVTLPTSGTLATVNEATMPSLTSIGTLVALDVSGTTDLSGSVTLGSTLSDSLTVLASLASDVLPDLDQTWDIGAPSFRFAEAHVVAAKLDSAELRNQGDAKFYEATANGTSYVALRAPSALSSSTTLTLPAGAGSNGQVLSTDGAGNLSWVNSGAGTAGGSDTQVQYNSSGTLTGSSGMTFDGTRLSVTGIDCSNNLNLTNENEVRFYEATLNGTSYAALRASASMASSVTWRLPAVDGSAGQILSTDGTGNLAWASAGASAAGGSDTQVQYNSSGTIAGSANMTFDGTTLAVAGLSCGGTVTLGDDVTDPINFTGRANTSFLPILDNTYDLGSSANRWANIYTGDLHLKNERGDWTLIEEEDALTIRNNLTGKVYNIMMTPREA